MRIVSQLRAVLALSLLALGARAGASDTWTELAGTTPAQWRVIWKEDPSSSATISWSTAEEGAAHRVYLSTRPSVAVDGVETRLVDCQRNGRYSLSRGEQGELAPAWYHHARLDGLEPSTTYWFVVESDGTRSPELHFVTAPRDDRPLRLISGGDSRTGHGARQVMNRFMGELADADPGLLAFAHGGDYVMDGLLWSHWSAWLSHAELAVSPSGRILPIIAVRGNHDRGPLFDEVFDDPGGAGKNYYVTRLAPEVALVTLNSEISTAGDQAVWLEERLAALRPSCRWLLAQFHRPVYPAVKAPAAAKSTWVPLFERHDVDAVLESDGHVVKRTVPIRAERQDPTGVTYLGEGGLGVPQRTPDTARWYLAPPGMAVSGHHVIVLSFSPAALDTRTVGPPASAEEYQPSGHVAVVEPGAVWRYLAGSDPSEDWAAPDFDDSAWRAGPAGFGFGDDDDTTQLNDMRRNYQRVYARCSVPAVDLAGREELALMIRYDDAFIAYAGGREVGRRGVEHGRGPAADGLRGHEAGSRYLYVPIPGWREQVHDGHLVLAVEGHNQKAVSSDFTLDPYLVADPENRAEVESRALRVLDEHRLLPRPRR